MSCFIPCAVLVFELDPDVYEFREDAGVVNLNISLAEGHVQEQLSIVLMIQPIYNNSNNNTATGKELYTTVGTFTYLAILKLPLEMLLVPYFNQYPTQGSVLQVYSGCLKP